MTTVQPLPTRGLRYRVKKLVLRAYPVLAKLLPDRHVPYRFSGGRIYLNVREHKNMLRRVLGLYEVNKVNALCAFLPPGGTFIDVGSNKGDFALIAAKRVGAAGTVIAFEPEPANCDWIRRSLDLNAAANVSLQPVALSDTDGAAVLFLGEKSGWHSLVSTEARHSVAQITVAKRTLDSFLAERGSTRVDVLKIDVEGAELEVLRGARATLAANPHVVLLLDLHPQMGVNVAEVAAFLTGLGFTLHATAAPYAPLTGAKFKEVLAKRPGVSVPPAV